MPEDDITLGELSRNLDRLRHDMDVRFASVERTIRDAQFVTVDRYNPEQSEQNRRIERIEDGNKWLSRLIIGTVVGLVINGLLLVLVARGGT